VKRVGPRSCGPTAKAEERSFAPIAASTTDQVLAIGRMNLPDATHANFYAARRTSIALDLTGDFSTMFTRLKTAIAALLRRAPSHHAQAACRRYIIQQVYTGSELVPWIVGGELRGLLEMHPNHPAVLHHFCTCGNVIVFTAEGPSPLPPAEIAHKHPTLH
jgi:hypothetical protein